MCIFALSSDLAGTFGWVKLYKIHTEFCLLCMLRFASALLLHSFSPCWIACLCTRLHAKICLCAAVALLLTLLDCVFVYTPAALMYTPEYHAAHSTDDYGLLWLGYPWYTLLMENLQMFVACHSSNAIQSADGCRLPCSTRSGCARACRQSPAAQTGTPVLGPAAAAVPGPATAAAAVRGREVAPAAVPRRAAVPPDVPGRAAPAAVPGRAAICSS